MNNPQPTYKQAYAFLRAAYTLKESLSDDCCINIEVDNNNYGIVLFKWKEDGYDCVGCSYSFFSLFSEHPTLTDEQNTKAINHCIDQAREKITENGGFKTE